MDYIAVLYTTAKSDVKGRFENLEDSHTRVHYIKDIRDMLGCVYKSVVIADEGVCEEYIIDARSRIRNTSKMVGYK